MAFDQGLGAISTGTVNHLVHDVAQGDHLIRSKASKGFSHILLPLQEQSLNAERADFNGIERSKNQVQSQPVGGNTDDKAKER